MSVDAPSKAEAVERAQRQIRLLAAEVARLSRTADLAPEQFYAEFLGRVVSAMGAVGGAVWVLDDARRLAPAYQVNLQCATVLGTPEGQLGHGRLLERVLASGEGRLASPHSGGFNGDGTNSTDFLLVLGPLKTEQEVTGVVEVFQRPEAAPEAHRGHLRFLLQMCALAGDFLKFRQLRQFSDRQVLWGQVEEFAAAVHEGLDTRQAAYTIANEGRCLVECDRLSVAINRGRKCVVEAVSGQDVLDRRSNTVRLLGELATAVVATEEPIWYTGDTASMAPQVEQTIQQYVDETHVKAIGVLPLQRKKRDAAEESEGSDDGGRAQPPIGALIVEQIEDNRLPPGMLHRVEMVCRHGSSSLANTLEHQSLFLMPLWRALGRTRWIVRARTLPKTIALLAAATAVAGWLLFWPADLEIQAQGTLQPVVRRNVYAPIGGRVEEIHVNHGDRVLGPGAGTGGHGTLLAVLRNSELEEELARVAGERSTVRQQIASVERSLLEEKRAVQDRNSQLAQLAEWKQDLENLDAQWRILQQNQQDLTVYSPTHGQVLTWDLHNLLIERPVQRGQRLLEIADTEGPWQLELRMPENRMGHVVRAQQELGAPLRVRFVLATDPGTEYEGTVVEIQPCAELRGEDGNTVLMKVQIDPKQIAHLTPGAEVSAKVDCGRCSVGYDLLHDVFAWLERLWFRF